LWGSRVLHPLAARPIRSYSARESPPHPRKRNRAHRRSPRWPSWRPAPRTVRKEIITSTTTGRLRPSHVVIVGRRGWRSLSTSAAIMRYDPKNAHLAGPRPLHPEQRATRRRCSTARPGRGRLLRPLTVGRRFASSAARSKGHPQHAPPWAGVEASTGSLGQGLSLGIGHALAARLDKPRLSRLRHARRRRDRGGPGLGSGHVGPQVQNSTTSSPSSIKMGYPADRPRTSEGHGPAAVGAGAGRRSAGRPRRSTANDMKETLAALQKDGHRQGQAERHHRQDGQGLADPGRS